MVFNSYQSDFGRSFGEKMISLESNKATALEFYKRFSDSDIEGVMATMTDDATFWIAGKARANTPSGTLTKPQIKAVFLGMLGRLKSGLKMTVHNIVAEGDRVALEVVSYGELKDGNIYDQEYHAVMQIRGGKIASIREYLDTQHVREVWFGNESAQNQKLLEHAFSQTAIGNGRAFLDAIADDAVWRIIGSTAWSQTYQGKKSIVENLLKPLNAQFATNNTIVAHHFLSAGEYVVVQARGKNQTRAGKDYENSYCWIFRLARGKVVELIEYADTALIEACLTYPASHPVST
jgi:uncharacterized protein